MKRYGTKRIDRQIAQLARELDAKRKLLQQKRAYHEKLALYKEMKSELHPSRLRKAGHLLKVIGSDIAKAERSSEKGYKQFKRSRYSKVLR
jgi:hypothetical protein